MRRLWGLLALVLLVGFYILAFGLLFGSLNAMGVGVRYVLDGVGWSTAARGGREAGWVDDLRVILWGFGFLAIGLIIFIPFARGIFAASAPSPAAVAGSVWVHYDDAPNLWKMVIDLAHEVGTRAPTELWLTAEANAAVSEDTWGLGLDVGIRRMYIGIPLLVGLRADELRAVLAHELGHYGGRHTRFGDVAYRGSVALESTRERVATSPGTVLTWALRTMLTLYAWLYNGATFAVRRRQEIEADVIAAKVAGKNLTADALRAAHMLVAAWSDFNARFLNPMGRAGYIPDDAFKAFATMIADPNHSNVLEGYRQRSLESRRRSRFDSHPPLRRRLARLERCAELAVSPDPRPSVELLGDSQTHYRRVWSARFRGEPRMPWRDWLNVIAELKAAERVRNLKLALDRLHAHQHKVTQSDLRLSTVLDLLETGLGEDLATTLAGVRGQVTTSERAKNLLREAVFTLVGLALIQVGRARWIVHWTEVGRWDTRDKEISPGEILDLVVEALTIPARKLRQRLVELGVEIEKPIPAAFIT